MSRPSIIPKYSNETTSKEAALSMTKCVRTIQREVFEIINACPCTCDELECMTGLPHQTASARIRELFQRGMVQDSGEKRQTRSGRNAIVWERTGEDYDIHEII